jgi:hypothetical protein
MKICKRCKRELPYSEFYVHKQMADGYLSFCKECTKERVLKHRIKNIDRIKEYDRNRPNKSERSKKHVVKQKLRRLTPDGRKSNLARSRLRQAVRSGKIVKPDKCECCNAGGPIEAHHPDYSKPLDVRWLCVKCHGKCHRKYNYDTFANKQETNN